MLKYGKKLGFVLFVILTLVMPFFNCLAAVEVGEDYLMYDFREYDGNSSLTYGKGINGNCYFPRKSEDLATFPEVYTFGYGTLSEREDGVVYAASKSGSFMSLTVDKVPAMYQQAVDRDFGYFILNIKANTKGEGMIEFRSLGSGYKKNFDVVYTGEWQRIVFDIADADGWQRKNSDGTYSDMSLSPWTARYFGADGFALLFHSFGENVKNEIVIDYFAYAREADTAIYSGKTLRKNAYIVGYKNGLVKPVGYVSRAQASAIVARAVTNSDGFECASTRFSDVTEDHWCSGYVAYLDSVGALSGYDGSFFPDEYMTKAEFSAMLTNACIAENNGISEVNGTLYGNGNYITRAEACSIVNGILGYETDFYYDDVAEIFNDLDKNHWGYGDIMSASVCSDIKYINGTDERIVTVLENPDYDGTDKMISEVDVRAQKLKESVHNTPNTVTAYEKYYYVSPNGNDSNSGTSPQSPWKTLKKVNAVGFTAGSTVFFERGGLWRGSLRILPGVTYTSYGEGEKPTFYGSLYDGADASLWTLVDGTENIWKFRYDMLDCGSVVFNHGEYHSDKETPSYKDGIYLHRNSSKVFDFKTDISENLGIFCDNRKELSKECPLYMRCDEGNPGELFDSIEFMPRQNILNVVANQNVLIDNFRIMYGGAHGIGAGTVKNITVRNCEFLWIGGSIHTYSSGGGTMPVRYGNAVECYGSPDGYAVENNYIYQVYDAGITHQLGENNDANGVQKNIRYANNLIEFCSYSIEYFLGKRADGSVDRYMENVVIEDNIMRYAGFGFGNQRTDRLCMSHIKTSGSYPNAVSEGFVIRNNVFDRSREMLLYIGAEKAEYLPVLENNVYIQYETKPETPYSTFGYYGAHPARLKFFSRDLRNTMRSENMEENPQIYFVKKDWLYELQEY